MKVVKKYTAIQLRSKIENDFVNAELSYGEIHGSYYDKTYPIEEFDTEDEAIEYAYKTNKYVNWLIVPIVKFD